VNSMRLSLMKAAHADVGGATWQEIRVAPSFSAHVRLGERGAPVQFPMGLFSD
jgi:antirestriction protein ArdC